MWLLFFSIAFVVLVQEMHLNCDSSLLRYDLLQRSGVQKKWHLSLFDCFLKRMMDIIISLMVCLTILPILYVVLGILIKLTSEGPIIFKQIRIGLLGDEFVCYKFRSMYINSGDAIVSQNDARITSVGKFMRRMHLDEFPQFFNVLRGDMSLVGPRPLRKMLVKHFDEMPEFNFRLLVRPGITGLSQIHSGRTLPLKNVFQYDKEYILTLSCWNDIKIIAKTIMLKDNAY